MATSKQDKTDQIIAEQTRTLDEGAAYFTSLIRPNTKPITDVHKYIEKNWDSQSFDKKLARQSWAAKEIK
jgi:hypothetical protein